MPRSSKTPTTPGLPRSSISSTGRSRAGSLTEGLMRSRLLVLLLVALVVPLVLTAQKIAPPDDVPGTFSILGFDPETGEIGAAVQSRVFSVGNGVLWAEAEVGAVATQAVVDVGYGPRGIELLKQGMAPKAIIEKVLAEDPGSDPRWAKTGRQFAVMNAKGEFAAFTGSTAPQESGD